MVVWWRLTCGLDYIKTTRAEEGKGSGGINQLMSHSLPLQEIKVIKVTLAVSVKSSVPYRFISIQITAAANLYHDENIFCH